MDGGRRDLSDADLAAMHVRQADRPSGWPGGATESLPARRHDRRRGAGTGAEAIHPGTGSCRASLVRRSVEMPASCSRSAVGGHRRARRQLPAPTDCSRARRPSGRGHSRARPGRSTDQWDGILAEAEGIGIRCWSRRRAGGGGRGCVASRRRMSYPLNSWVARGGDVGVWRGSVYSSVDHVGAAHRGAAPRRRHGSVVAIASATVRSSGGTRTVEERPLLVVVEASWAPRARGSVGTAAGLRNAATAEFLRSADWSFLFLEVTPAPGGAWRHGARVRLDIVREQFLLAADIALGQASTARSAPRSGGARHRGALTAEDPSRDFVPSRAGGSATGSCGGSRVRVDTPRGRRSDPAEYDNLVAKLMVHAADRDQAIARLGRALNEMEIAGIQTTLPFHRFVATDPSLPP